MYLFLSICVHDDMEIETVYTDTYLKTTSPKNDRGSRSENSLRGQAAGGENYDCIHYPHIGNRGIRWTKAPRIDEGVAAGSRDWPAHAQGNNKRPTTNDYGGGRVA